MPPSVDLIGQKFGRLIVIERMNNDKYGNSRWLCECCCGEMATIVSLNLKSGDTKSCGCLREKVTQNTGHQNIKHGHCINDKESITYESWRSMIKRCTDQNNKDYQNYGGRGITVCDRWLKFENFLEDVKERPASKYTLDRVNNNKGYFKSNCVWATRKEQQRNKRNSCFVTYQGITRLVIELAKEYNISYKTLWVRLYKLGWSIEKALTTPVKRRKNE